MNIYFLSLLLITFLSTTFTYAYGETFNGFGIKFEYPDGNLVEVEEFNPEEDSIWYIVKIYSANMGNEAPFTITLMDPYLKLNPQTLQLEPVSAKQQYESGIKTIEEHSDNKIVKLNESYKIGVAKINGYRIDAFSSDESHYGFGMYSQNPITNGTIQYDYWDKQEEVPQSIREVENILRTIEFIDISNSTSTIVKDPPPKFVRSSPLYGDIVTISSPESLTDDVVNDILSQYSAPSSSPPSLTNDALRYNSPSTFSGSGQYIYDDSINNGDERCPNGYHRSPDGDCERVTDTKGQSRCPNGYHRSPDGDCERVRD